MCAPRLDYPMGFMGTGPGAHVYLVPNEPAPLPKKTKNKTKHKKTDMIFVGLISCWANSEFKLHIVKELHSKLF